MRRLISKETGLLILAGFTLFFLMAQISIFQVSFHVGDSSVTFSHGERTTARLFPETRAFVNVSKNSGSSSYSSDKLFKCDIPEDPLFPLCALKVKEFNKTWNQKCHGEKYKVDPSSMCSVLQYLSEVQSWCPVLPWRSHKNTFDALTKPPKTTIQTNLSVLLDKFEGERYSWMRNRIQDTWPHWIKAVEELGLRVNLHERKRKKILIYMAGLGVNNLLDYAYRGGPLGELSQWCDLISVLHILGHDVIIGFLTEHIPRSLLHPSSDGCARLNMTDGLDLIFTDIQGAIVIREHNTPDYSRHRCKLRIVDSFGTDAEFNYKFYNEKIPGGRSGWGDLNLHLSQFLTMYPHSPDNSFLGFAVPQRSRQHNAILKGPKARKAAFVYGKKALFWKGNADYINTVKRHFSEVHATLGGTDDDRRVYSVPEYVIDHGIVNTSMLISLLESSKVFVGLGEPFEGPGALEALANGCFFLNPKYVPPLDRTNADFFAGKPVNRKVTSQNPYAEVFVGKPFVQTVDIHNLTEVEEALQEIINTEGEAHLPYEFTHVGMLERVNAYIENQDFCKPTNWPPLSELKIALGGEGEACVEACLKRQLTCEPKFFESLNTKETLTRAAFRCTFTLFRESIMAPSFDTSDNTCLLQSQPLLFSCRAAKPGVVRVCPCRSYRKEQVALCETC
ncbi:alpha-1,6-mannosylglycoprotein 6-beta-N-acetylglucosaminyltransferase A-like [Oculina patagonica]